MSANCSGIHASGGGDACDERAGRQPDQEPQPGPAVPHRSSLLSKPGAAVPQGWAARQTFSAGPPGTLALWPIRIVSSALLFVAALALAGCNYACMAASQVSTAPVVPPRGFLISHFKAPLVLPGDVNLRESKGGYPDKRVIYVRIPFVSADFSVGHADIKNAVRQAGIKTLLYADYEYLSVLGYVKTVTVHAYGYPD